MRLLLVSNSTLHGSGYLDHCAEAIAAFLGPSVARVLFVPYAVFDRDGYAAKARKRFEQMGLELDRHRARDGMPYLGTSAGSNVACPTIKTTNDMPIVEPPTLEALGLVPFNINPHYQDPVAGSTHMGETREQRIAEFHEENDPPVVGLREGAWLAVEGRAVSLQGSTGARLFRRGEMPVEYASGSRLDFLIA
jgi:dipeptidase E